MACDSELGETLSNCQAEFDIARRGRERRAELGLTIGEVAARMKRKATWVYLLERDGAGTLRTIRMWAKALEMSPRELAFGND